MNSPLEYLKKYCESKHKAYLSGKPAKFFGEQFDSISDALQELSANDMDKAVKELWDSSSKDKVDFSKEAFRRSVLAANADLLAAFRYFNTGSEDKKQLLHDKLKRYPAIDAKTINSHIQKIHSLGDLL